MDEQSDQIQCSERIQTLLRQDITTEKQDLTRSEVQVNIENWTKINEKFPLTSNFSTKSFASAPNPDGNSYSSFTIFWKI